MTEENNKEKKQRKSKKKMIITTIVILSTLLLGTYLYLNSPYTPLGQRHIYIDYEGEK